MSGLGATETREMWPPDPLQLAVAAVNGATPVSSLLGPLRVVYVVDGGVGDVVHGGVGDAPLGLWDAVYRDREVRQ